jgi:hypothetical protein
MDSCIYARARIAHQRACELVSTDSTVVGDSLYSWLNEATVRLCLMQGADLVCRSGRETRIALVLIFNYEVNDLAGYASESGFVRSGLFTGWNGDTLRIYLNRRYLANQATTPTMGALAIIHELYCAYQTRRSDGAIASAYVRELNAWQYQAKLYLAYASETRQKYPFPTDREGWLASWCHDAENSQEAYAKLMLAFIHCPDDAMRYVYRNQVLLPKQ